MPEVTFNLFPAQIKLLKATEKNIVAVLSRGYGKSFSLSMWCLYKLLSNSNIGMLICPTYNMLRETVKYLLKHTEDMGLEYSINSKPHWCNSLLSDHKNIFSLNCRDGKHHYIKLASGDNPEGIRGTSCDFIAFDECALLDESIVDIATPCLRGKGSNFNYQQVFATTPRDTSNWLYKRYVAQDIPSTIHIKAQATENFIEFTDEKLEYFRSILTDLMWKREILAEWVDLASNSMFYAFSDNHIQDRKLDGRLFLSCDQNTINLQTLVGYLGRDEIHIDNEILIPEAGNAQKVAQSFHKLYSNQQIRQVYAFGDRFGNNKSVVASSSYYQQLKDALKQLGWNMVDRTNDKNPSVWDSTELTNRFFEKNKITISSRCKEFIRHLKEVKWKENEFVMDKKFLDSGFCDDLRYVLWDNFKPGSNIIATNNLLK